MVMDSATRAYSTPWATPLTRSCGSTAETRWAVRPPGIRSLQGLSPRREHGLLALVVQPHGVHALHPDVVVGRDRDPVGQHAGLEVLEGFHRRDELLARGL